MLYAINAEPKLPNFSPAEDTGDAAYRDPFASYTQYMDLALHCAIDILLDLLLVSDFLLLCSGYEFGNESTLCAARRIAFTRVERVMLLDYGIVV